MAKYGYCRVSTIDQDLSTQIDALKAYGCETIRQEKKSGTSMNGREELKLLIEFLRDGDELVVTRIDRLARNVRDLQNIVHTLSEKGVSLKATEQPIDTSSAAGKCFLDMLAVFSSFETALRAERQAEGIKRAKARGVYRGRKQSIDGTKVKELKASGLGASQIVKELGISRASVYRYLST